MSELEKEAKKADKKLTHATDLCTYCPRLCRHACPVGTASARESLTPRNKMLVLGEWRNGAAKPNESTAELMWGCSDCGACEDACLHENPVGEGLYSGRDLAQKAGVAPAAFRGAGERFMVQLNPFGESLLKHEENALGAVPRPLNVGPSTKSSPVLIIGCHTLRDQPELVRAGLAVARRIDPTVELAHLYGRGAPMSLCCGRTLREAGEIAHYEEQQERVRHELAPRKAVWVLEGACLEDLQRAAPHARSLAEAMVQAELKPQRRVSTLTVQVSCGERKSKADEAVLALAQRAAEEVRTPLPDVPFAGCCGGRGGLREAMPKVADAMAEGRRQELAATHEGTQDGAQVASFSAACCKQLGGDTIHLLELFA